MDEAASETFGVVNAVRHAWTLLWEHAVVLIGATILAGMVMGIINLPVTIMNEEVADALPGLSGVRETLGVFALVIEIVFGALGWMMQTFFLVGMGKLYLRAVRGKSVELYDIIITPRQFGIGLVVSLLYTVSVMLGLLACVFPALAIVILLYLWNFVVVDQDKGSLGVLQESARLVLFAPAPVLLVFLASMGLLLIGFMACCVGIFVAAPLVGLCWAQLYDWLVTAAPPPLETART